MEEKINIKIDEIMDSLHEIQKAAPDPFFFTRLEARMQNQKSTWEQISSFVSQPVVAFACICLIVLINLAVIFSSANTQKNTDEQSTEIATTDEYNLVSSTFYEFVNSKP